MGTPAPKVLIVGGGAAGLTSSIMLGQLGVDSLLVERHPGTSLVPKAHILHSRTMEILAQFRIEDDVREVGSPQDNFSQTSWLTSLGGEDVWDRREKNSVPSWSGATLAPYYAALTAHPMGNTPQHLLEPVLRAKAVEVNGADRLLFHTEVVALEQEPEGVTVTLLDRDSGDSQTISATYVIGADGGKSIGRMIGVEMVGPEPFVDVVSLSFTADLSELLHDDTSLIRLFLQPQLDGTVRRFGLVASGPAPWDRTCRHWRSAVVLPVGAERHPETFTEEAATSELRQLFKLPDLEISDMTMNHWLMESVVADRFQVDRVFLVGDAAHRHSPMGGLGLNTGIQDVHNLTWKLAAVLAGSAAPGLLDTYEPERMPVGRRRVQFATFSFFNHLSVGGGFGMLPGATEEHNRTVLEALFDETADGEMRRTQLHEMVLTLRREFQHADIDLGFEYADSPAVTADGTGAPPRDPVGHVHQQVARPGHRMPHAWLQGEGGAVSTHGLMVPGTFLLLTGANGDGWAEAATTLSGRLALPLLAYVIGEDRDLVDRDGAWTKLRGHGDDGAILVRPDGHVAFRSRTYASGAEAALAGALDVALGATAALPTLTGG